MPVRASFEAPIGGGSGCDRGVIVPGLLAGIRSDGRVDFKRKLPDAADWADLLRVGR